MLRCLFISSITLAFAQPTFTNQSSSLNNQNLVLVLDNSASMQADINGIPLFEQLKTSAITYVQQLPSSKKVGIYTADGDLTANTFVSKEVAINLIQSLEISKEQFTPQNAFDAYNGSNTNYHLISDFQKSSLPNQVVEFNQFQAEITAQQLTPTATSNIYFSNYLIENSEIGSTSTIVSFIENPSKEQVSCAFQLLDSSQIYQSGKLDLTPGLNIDTFFIDNSNLNSTLIELKLLETANNFDNSVFFNVGRRKNYQILVVSDYPSKHWNALSNISSFQISIITQEEFQTTQVDGFNLCVLDCITPNGSTVSKWNSMISNSVPNWIIANKDGFQIGNIQIQKEEQQKTPLKTPENTSLFSYAFQKLPKNLNKPSISSLNRINNAELTSILVFENNLPFFSKLKNQPTFFLHTSLKSDFAQHSWFPLMFAVLLDNNRGISQLDQFEIPEGIQKENIVICKGETCEVPQLIMNGNLASILPTSVSSFGLYTIKNREDNEIISYCYVPVSNIESDLTPANQNDWQQAFSNRIKFVTSVQLESLEKQNEQSLAQYCILLAGLLIFSISFVELRLK